jgi:uncharacterized iron-regulated membrane protein
VSRDGAASAARGGRLALALHRWLGLTLGLVLMSAGLSGALLVIVRPVDHAVNSALHEARATGLDARALDEAVRRIGESHPGSERVVRLPRAPGGSVRVDVRGPWHGEVFVDPSSGAELGRRADDEGFANLLFEWHSALLSGSRGKAVLFAAALSGIAAIVAGVVLWWPARWGRAFQVQWRANLPRQVLDLHRVGGVLAAALVLVSIVSGMYMAWRPVSSWANALGGYTVPSLPRVTPEGPARAPLSRLVASAEAALPEGRVTIVVLPAEADQPVRVRKRMPDEVHPNGLSSVYLHPSSAAVLRIVPWRDGGPGMLGFEYLYPLHIGELGGPWHRVLTAAAGLALFLLGASGVWLWWKRGMRLW